MDIPPRVRSAAVLLIENPALGDPDADGWTLAGRQLYTRMTTAYARATEGNEPEWESDQWERMDAMRKDAEDAVSEARTLLAENPALRRDLRAAIETRRERARKPRPVSYR